VSVRPFSADPHDGRREPTSAMECHPGGTTESAASSPLGNLLLDAEPEVDVEQALAVARRLVECGIPVFVAEPATDAAGDWDHRGGTGKTGYWLPKAWQKKTAALSEVARWRPGMALCAVMGHGLDLLDLDPRNDGHTSHQELENDGVWPIMRGRAQSPSGWHEFVASMGVSSRDNVRPGFDVKAGTAGEGHGFAFIAPTVKLSKTTGLVTAYRWDAEPNLEGLEEDRSGERLADLIRALRRTGKARSRSSRLQLEDLPGGSPCQRMQQQVEAVRQPIADGSRHRRLLGPVLQLVRLAKSGHRGLGEALTAIKSDLLARVKADELGGVDDTEDQWGRLVQGALDRVFGDTPPPRYPCCSCVVPDFRVAMDDGSLFSSGKAGLSERAIMRYLLGRAERGGSFKVIESQRQIAEAVDHQQPTISRAAKRLETLGWVTRSRRRAPGTPDVWYLRLPTRTTTTSTTRPPVELFLGSPD